MAWLQNLAGKAEDLLNKIDQNAATVLNDSKMESHDPHDESIATNFDPNTATTDFIIEDELKVVEDDYSPSKKSLSSHNSFILGEEIVNYNEVISKLEFEVSDLNKQLLHLQHLNSELRNDNVNLQARVESSESVVKMAQSEMEQYKARVQRILQEKSNLKLEQHTDSTDNIISSYNDELKKEIEFQQNKNSELLSKVHELSQEVSVLQQQLLISQNSSQKQIQAIQENLLSEQRFRTIAEDECRVKTQELHVKLQELNQQYQILQTKTEEIDRLQDALKQKTNVNLNNEFESRFRSLTETLMVKQNAIETITTERNALRLQLEKLETKYNNLTQLQRAQVQVINVNDTDDVKSQVPHFMRVSPLDAGVTRRVKRAYTTLDAISIRTEVFFKRYPVARVFVFCYIILLHFWALILLFVYAPSSR